MQKDYIIIGQGLAGSLLAYELLQQGKSIHIFDNHHEGAASSIAAGIINPITGRRFAKSWRIDQFLPFAKEYYQKIEQRFNINIFHDRAVLRFLHGNKDINDWYGRSSWEGFGEYMQEYENMEELADHFHLPFGIGVIKPSAQIDIPLLIKTFKEYFQEKNVISDQKIDYQLLKQNDIKSAFNGIDADKIIFCEGYQAQFNPAFDAIPFEPAKGEVLFVKIPNLNFKDLLKNKIMIAPLGNDLYWTGSNYEWNATHDRPTESFKTDFIKKLQKTLKLPFEVIYHKAAIRPSVKDRRPVLGSHPRNPKIAIFNGLGTKGASLGPYWAKHLANHLLNNTPLEPEVNLSRFYV